MENQSENSHDQTDLTKLYSKPQVRSLDDLPTAEIVLRLPKGPLEPFRETAKLVHFYTSPDKSPNRVYESWQGTIGLGTWTFVHKIS